MQSVGTDPRNHGNSVLLVTHIFLQVNGARGPPAGHGLQEGGMTEKESRELLPARAGKPQPLGQTWPPPVFVKFHGNGSGTLSL